MFFVLDRPKRVVLLGDPLTFYPFRWWTGRFAFRVCGDIRFGDAGDSPQTYVLAIIDENTAEENDTQDRELRKAELADPQHHGGLSARELVVVGEQKLANSSRATGGDIKPWAPLTGTSRLTMFVMTARQTACVTSGQAGFIVHW